jgi:glycerophosphoryl diester phosphodiesterase
MTRIWTSRKPHRPAFIGLITLLSAWFGLLIATPANAACYNYPCNGPTDAVAHRGDVQYYPQLSFNGIKSAIDKGADWVEIDVHWNEPSQRLILIHDDSCGSYNVETTPVSTLEQCMGQPILYLDNLLSYWTPRGFDRWLIELKASCAYPGNPLGCEASSYVANRVTLALYLDLNLYALHEKVWVQSFDNFMLQDLRAHRGGSPYPRLMKIRPLDASWWNNVSSGYMNDVKAMGYQAINVDIRSTSPNSVAYAHSIGLLFATWAIGSYEAENDKAVYDLDADFHVTDRLDHLLDITSGSSGGGGDPEEWECSPYARTCG